MAEKQEDLGKFLKDVDEVETIIKNLSSHDEEKQKEAMKASEILLKKKEDNSCNKFNKTIVVDAKHKENTLDHQEQLLKSIESDANERASRRKKNEAEAKILKEKGNVAFKAGQHEEAIECYTEAINLVKYFTALYTNRAQTYIKLGNYDAAIDDCKWAIRLDEKCVKAYVHCGRALQKKACFSEAITYFRNAGQIDPKQERVIKGYIAQVENERQKNCLERKAVEERDSGNERLKCVSETVKALMGSKTKLEECIGFVKILEKLLENSKDCKTLFRVTNAFDCFNEYTDFKRLCDMADRWDLPEQGNFVNEMLHLAKVAVAEDEHNLESLLDHGIINTIYNLTKTCTIEAVLLGSLTLLLQITEFSLGRKRILEHINNDRYFIDELLLFITTANAISKIVLGCMNNLSLEQRFSSQYSVQLEKIVLPIVMKFVSHPYPVNVSQSMKLPLVTSCFSTLANLARMKDSRSRLQRNRQIWEAFVKILSMFVDEIRHEVVSEMVYAVLGLLINVLADVSEYAKSFAPSVYPLIHKLLVPVPQDHITLLQRTIGVLRLLLDYSSAALELACNDGTYKILLAFINQTSDAATISYGVKCLALCTVRNATARKYILDHGLMIFHKLLKSESEVTIGNSAVVLGSCFEQEEAGKQFVGTPIVKDMLTVATKEKLSKVVKQNVAIALAKLVKNDVRFRDQLRELHGLEILHTVIKSNILQ